MNTMEPPRWAEGLLRISLCRRDYEVVSGDLLEDFNEGGRGRRAAAVYVWQALVASMRLGLARRLMMILALFLVPSMLWFAFMEMRLLHPDRILRSIVAFGIIGHSIVTLQIARGHLTSLKPVVLGGSMIIGSLGAFAFLRNLVAQDFEGYIALISAALVLQTLVSFLAIPAATQRARS